MKLTQATQNGVLHKMATITWGKTDADFDCTFVLEGVSYIIAPDSTTKKYVYWDPSSPNVYLDTDNEAIAIGGGDHYIIKIQEDGDLVGTIPSKLVHTSEVVTNAITLNGDDYVVGSLGMGSGYQTICTCILNVTGDADVYINFSCIAWGDEGSLMEFVARRDHGLGGATSLAQISSVWVNSSGLSRWFPVALNCTDYSENISKGEHTYSVIARTISGDDGNVAQRSIHAHEFKK